MQRIENHPCKARIRRKLKLAGNASRTAGRRLVFERLQRRDLLALSGSPSSTLVGLNDPAALAVNSAETLYVANSGGNTVSEFAPGATSASVTLAGLDGPDALVFDSSGNLYVANGTGNTVSKFAPGATTPTATLSGLYTPDALAFDSSGNLYVANFGGSTVSKFTPGATVASATFTGLDGPDALAFDSNGDLFVANLYEGSVSEFAPGATQATATLTGLNYPDALAFDQAGDLFVANSGYESSGSTVSEFAAKAVIPTATLTGLAAADALAFDASGNLYVANGGSGTVSEFSPGATSPFGDLTSLNHPDALAFDSSGDLFVANGESTNTVSKFLSATTQATLTITGQAGDNAEISFSDATDFTVTVNGSAANYNTSRYGKVVYQGPAGQAAEVQLFDPITSDSYQATQSLTSTTVVRSGFEFDAENVESLFVYVSDPNSSSTVNVAAGTGANYYVDAAKDDYSYIADPAAPIYSELSGFGAETVTGSGGSTYAYVYSSSLATFVGDPGGSTFTAGGSTTTLANFPQLYLVGSGDGSDSATLHTEGGSFVGTPGFSYVAGTFNGASFLIGALYAAKVTAQATNASDSAFFYSYGDTFAGSTTASSLTGSAKSFASYSTFVTRATGFQAVTDEVSGDGSDVANLTSPGSGTFISTPTVSTLSLKGVTVLTVITSTDDNGTYVAVPSQVNITGGSYDTAFLYDGPGSNSLVAAGNKAALTARSERSIGGAICGRLRRANRGHKRHRQPAGDRLRVDVDRQLVRHVVRRLNWRRSHAREISRSLHNPSTTYVPRLICDQGDRSRFKMRRRDFR